MNNSLQYKTLLSYLPGMASVVNSFNSEQVQVAVFDRLISALEQRTETTTSPVKIQEGNAKIATASAKAPSDELEQDLIEGDSIHSVIDSEV